LIRASFQAGKISILPVKTSGSHPPVAAAKKAYLFRSLLDVPIFRVPTDAQGRNWIIYNAFNPVILTAPRLVVE
jgi:hypothetical protein